MPEITGNGKWKPRGDKAWLQVAELWGYVKKIKDKLKQEHKEKGPTHCWWSVS